MCPDMPQNDTASVSSARGKHGLLKPKFLLVTLAMTAVILHGSLYPYEFRVPPGPIGPLTALLRSWSAPRDSFGEMIANVLLYMPFGFFATLSLCSRFRFAIVAAIGLGLCTAVELVQFYDVGRVTSLSDVCLNTLGTVLGATAAAMTRIPSMALPLRKMLARPVPVILLLAMLGYHLYPYVPTIDLIKYWHTVKPLLLRPAIVEAKLLHYFVLWLTVCFLLSDAVRAWSALFILGFALFVFGATVAIIDQSLSLSEMAGAAAAILFWLTVLGHTRWAAAIVAAALCVTIILWRLEPFRFLAAGGAFGWVPFRSLLSGSFGINVQSFCEKAFLYGSLIWIAARAGLDLRISTIATAVLVLLTSLVETHIPGRSAEITGAVIALIMGGIFVALSGPVVSEGRPPSRATP
jgi:VanZ family protein